MSEKERQDLGPDELEEQNAELLPDREEMTVVQSVERIGGGITLPIEPSTVTE